ncbi:CHASE domain-containing protein [Rubellimicrobium roseum]|uniref:histidine kinase n=1 Tax=Rubellimicrobium roseum TaxID=687525 RepID=A0A5C4NL97_9RHOB|nr:CHASE domain-containing protein [Rubellimicrobium roseum]TNC74892.1 hypothetical protein FHG71_01815 [Rubellimicrobium roseum]
MFSPSRLSASAIAALSLVGAGLTWSIYGIETSRREEAFARLLVEAAGYVETRVEQHIALLNATRSFLAVHDEPTRREDFAAFVDGLELEAFYSGLQELGFARILRPEQEAGIEGILSRAYGGDRRVWPEPVPGLRTAIVLLEPDHTRGRASLGFDMATEEQRRAAMLKASETGAATATPPLTLDREVAIRDGQPGILVYLPVRPSGAPEIEGYAFAPVRVGDLLTAVLERYDLPLELRLADAAAPDVPLFESAGFALGGAEGDLEMRTSLSVAGREWVLSAAPSPEFGAAIQLRLTLFSAIVFPLLVVLAGVAVHWQGISIRRTRALNELVQHNVEQKDLLLREMAHRMKNSLTRVSAIARQTARESVDKAAMAESLNARLQAMSAAQDLLVMSGTDSADLAELLRFEIDQISASAANPGHLSGPPVRLDERQTHALAVVFHELATNALKYGAGAGAGGEVRVHWTMEPGPSGIHLRLTWEERTPGLPSLAGDAAPGQVSGFGTRLLEAMIGGELGGSLTRQSRPGVLTIEIRFPLNPDAQVTAG